LPLQIYNEIPSGIRKPVDSSNYFIGGENLMQHMMKWLEDLHNSSVKKAMPVLSFPAIQLMGITVLDLINDSDLQAKAMKMIADRVDSAASLSLMDLSVEAECFGSEIRKSDYEVPTVTGSIVTDMQSAERLSIPEIGTGRTGIYIDAVTKAKKMIQDRPVFAGMIGPFSLSGRLLNVTEIMVHCYDDPELVHAVMEKSTEFLINYAKAYKKSGANGIIMAEPLTGILSPVLARKFSSPYVKKIVDEIQDDNFLVIYHNCGNNTIQMIDSILSTGAAAFHFGNSIDMSVMLQKIPEHIIVMGNIDPAKEIKGGTPQSVRKATLETLEKCSHHPNFVISSGCDIPPLSSWENIDAFFGAVKEYYDKIKNNDNKSAFLEKE
jgi:uroporphyrinogen decarboxylase